MSFIVGGSTDMLREVKCLQQTSKRLVKSVIISGNRGAVSISVAVPARFQLVE